MTLSGHWDGLISQLTSLTDKSAYLRSVGRRCAAMSVCYARAWVSFCDKCRSVLLGRPTSVGKALSFTHELSFLSTHRAHQSCRGRPSNVFRRFGRSFNNWYRNLAHSSPNFHRRVKKCEIWHRLKHHSILSRPHLKMQQDIRILKQICNVAMIALCSGQVWWIWVHAPLRKLCHFWPNPNIARKNVLNRQYLSRGLFDFALNFVQSLNAWHPKCCNSSRSRGQRSRSRRDNMWAKIRKIR